MTYFLEKPVYYRIRAKEVGPNEHNWHKIYLNGKLTLFIQNSLLINIDIIYSDAKINHENLDKDNVFE